jgi:hypothetical protein
MIDLGSLCLQNSCQILDLTTGLQIAIFIGYLGVATIDAKVSTAASVVAPTSYPLNSQCRYLSSLLSDQIFGMSSGGI